MKKIITITFLVSSAFFISSKHLNSNPTGAPAGYTGSPADGQTCGVSGCHNTSTTTATSNLTTNVPSTGYEPGKNYTITVSIAGSGKKGFQVSPQNANGTLMGTIASGTGSHIIGSKYVTHSSQKTTNPGTWTFTWTAPAKGSGSVNFYGAFVNNMQNVSTQTITVQEAQGTNIITTNTEKELNIYPNPIQDVINVELNIENASNICINLVSLDGKLITNLFKNDAKAGLQKLSLSTNEVKAGIYILQVKANNTTTNKKVIIQ